MTMGLQFQPKPTPAGQETKEPCHILDDKDRPLCGVAITGKRPPHDADLCKKRRHPQCGTCISLLSLEMAV